MSTQAVLSYATDVGPGADGSRNAVNGSHRICETQLLMLFMSCTKVFCFYIQTPVGNCL